MERVLHGAARGCRCARRGVGAGPCDGLGPGCWAVAEPGFHGWVFQVQKIFDAYAIVVSIKLIHVHSSSSIYIIFLKYMLGKLFFTPVTRHQAK